MSVSKRQSDPAGKPVNPRPDSGGSGGSGPPGASGPPGGGGPRVLLRQIRDIMAQPTEAQERLNRLVSVIASNMVAEVCSIYIGDPSDVLELFATTGLNPEAVHKTRLHVGEGLVGEIARTAQPLNLSDAQEHSKFAYRPETGEDPFQSFLGVPILKGGHVLGVLVVQNQIRRHYDHEEVEALQTVAMVLAEVAASGQLIPIDDTIIEEEVRPRHVYSSEGETFVSGVAVGHVFLHAPPITVVHVIAEDIEAEIARLDNAIEELNRSIEKLLTRSAAELSREPREVLEAYQMFARDRGWLRRMHEAIRNGLSAEAAVEQVQNDTRVKMTRQSDPYIRDRLHDLDELANRLLRILMRVEGQVREVPDDAIIVASNLGPADLLDYDPKRLRGVVLEEGTSFSHVVIVARSLGVPLVGRVDGIVDHARDGDPIIVDGETGNVHLRPDEDVITSYQTKISLIAEQEESFNLLRDLPAVTLDGVRVTLNMNAGLLVDLPNLEAAGADGIGLFRTELQFMIASKMPTLREQVVFYRQVLDAADGKPIVFRTLDLGGDKFLPYGKTVPEVNPALGMRAIRLALSRPSLLRYQLRALLLAAQERELRLIFPMIATVEEFRQARAELASEIERLRRFNKPVPTSVQVGSMIEVPGLVFQLDELLPQLDFVSIGSNDLFQFIFAVDRANAQVGGRYDFLNVAILRVIRQIIEKCNAAGVELSLCGEVSGEPLEAMTLIGLGLRSLSMPASQLGRIKAMVRNLRCAKVNEYVSGLLVPDGAREVSVRAAMQRFAAENKIATTGF